MKRVLIDFYADWCTPCKIMEPIIDEIQKEYPDIEIKKIDADSDIDMVKKYNVAGIPTYILEEDGKVIKSVKGAIPKYRFIKELGLDAK